MPRVVVLGATGFIGRNLVEGLAADPAIELIAVRHRRPAFAHPGVTWLDADLTSESDVERVLAGADHVLHAAAATAGAGANLADPLAMVVDNQVMNARVFAAAQRCGVGHVLWLSCSIMYASSDRPQREEDFNPSVPLHPAYAGAGLTKVYFERMCSWLAGMDRARFTVLRHSNLYGPHDKYDPQRSHVFGATITKTLTTRDGRLVMWGKGREGRDLLHVDDLVAAVRAAMAGPKVPFALYNVGSGTPVPIFELARRIVAISGRSLEITHDETKPSIPVTIALDSTRFREATGWHPEIGLDEGIARTIAWWRAHRPIGVAPE